ncbi:hypothetical protein ABH931_003698 [Streptacidiphilus sp. MAP12-33]|uniref:hypothetical protein n=1 Tax=Streptacidiphilus sp. MAP12-33 TaxID=3156266 RepID=UPI00351391FA
MIRGPKQLGDLLTAAVALDVHSSEDLRILARALGLPLPTPGQGGAVDPGRPAHATPRPGSGVHTSTGPAAPAPLAPPATLREGRPGAPDPTERPTPQPGSAGGGAGSLAVAASVDGIPPFDALAPLGLAGRPAHAPVVEAAPPATGSLTTLNGPDPGRGPRPPAATTAPTPLFEVGRASAAAMPAPWDPRAQRGVLFAAASTDVEGREVDPQGMAELVVRVATGGSPRRPRRSPRRIRPTTRQGALLLLDRGAAMEPYRDDRVWLTELAAAVLRRDRIEVRDVRGGRVSHDGGRSWQEYQPPAPGRPVLVLSDLGALPVPFVERTATTSAQWLTWLRGIRRMGNPVACLTPFPPEVYPAALRQAVALVPLDHRTTIGAVRAETRRLRDRGPHR